MADLSLERLKDVVVHTDHVVYCEIKTVSLHLLYSALLVFVLLVLYFPKCLFMFL